MLLQINIQRNLRIGRYPRWKEENRDDNDDGYVTPEQQEQQQQQPTESPPIKTIAAIEVNPEQPPPSATVFSTPEPSPEQLFLPAEAENVPDQSIMTPEQQEHQQQEPPTASTPAETIAAL